MIEVGYKLSSEEFGARELVAYAARAESAGFDFALISDHFHPWTDRQGQSPFVWGLLGAIGQATSRIRVGTAVTCPIIRTHPAIVAHAAATAASLMPGRFFLGVGTGENLNEHVVGCGWPAPGVRLEMLAEAIDVLRLLWEGGTKNHRGRHYTVEDARLYTLPDEPPEIMVGASRPRAVELAGESGDAMINPEVDPSLVRAFRSAGGKGKPCYVELSVCWAKDERRARKTAHEIWALAGLEGTLFTELRTPTQFEAAFKPITEEKVAEAVICGPDVRKHLEAIEKASRAGYTHACVHQIGPEQEGFFEFYESEVLPRIPGRASRKSAKRALPVRPQRESKRASRGSGRRRVARLA
jgi:coenzyme F420-dependent glucose-6-phosphate dehydrogenase